MLLGIGKQARYSRYALSEQAESHVATVAEDSSHLAGLVIVIVMIQVYHTAISYYTSISSKK